MSKRFELVPSMNLEGKSNGRLIRDNEEDYTLTAVEICLELNKQDERLKRLEALLYIFNFIDSNNTSRDDVKDILELMNDYDFTWDDVYTILYAYIIKTEKVM